ncbi:unnamed protein product [Didymodactylos carnosus]|uniref:RING-type domain-containing protein n=1 Tax=Didymodactylos carnosus TaxID=1234261 RepID=A0A815DVI9_9BILA|nr:unnamed protein product [Didymodactylos carnosus]CAF4132331.1 unnamed protein product [Didymodactylos carnosus]
MVATGATQINEKMKQYTTPSERFYARCGKTIEKIKNHHTLAQCKHATHEIPTTSIDIKKEEDDSENVKPNFVEPTMLNEIRSRTFSHWSIAHPSKTQMIEAGFFYTNVNDRVLCIHCNLICQQWAEEDEPEEVHKLLSPNCCYFTRYLKLTRPIVNDQSLSIINTSGIVLTSACHGEYIELQKREATFSTWPKDQQSPSIHDFIQAGFYYTGLKTIVTCFFCNGSLQNWSSQDRPHIEHARWFPHCNFIRQFCGNDLYQRIQQTKQVKKQTETTGGTKLQTLDENTLSKMVASRLDTQIAQRLSNQFKVSIIKRAYEDQLRLKLDDFATPNDLFVACLILQKQIENINGNKDKIVIPTEKLKQIKQKENQTIENDRKCEYETEVKLKASEINICVLCREEEKQLACIPCGHLCTCTKCSQELQLCPICKGKIQAFVKVYV